MGDRLNCFLGSLYFHRKYGLLREIMDKNAIAQFLSAMPTLSEFGHANTFRALYKIAKKEGVYIVEQDINTQELNKQKKEYYWVTSSFIFGKAEIINYLFSIEIPASTMVQRLYLLYEMKDSASHEQKPEIIVSIMPFLVEQCIAFAHEIGHTRLIRNGIYEKVCAGKKCVYHEIAALNEGIKILEGLSLVPEAVVMIKEVASAMCKKYFAKSQFSECKDRVRCGQCPVSNELAQACRIISG